MFKFTKYLKRLKTNLQELFYPKFRKLYRLILISLMLVALVLLMSKGKKTIEYPKEGDFSPSFFKAPFEFYYEDKIATQLKEKEAILHIKPVYNLNLDIIPSLTNRINAFFNDIKSIKQREFKDEVSRLSALKLKMDKTNLSDDNLIFLLRYSDLDKIEKSVINVLKKCLKKGITFIDEKKLESDIMEGITIIRVEKKIAKKLTVNSLDEFYQLKNIESVAKKFIDISFGDKTKNIIKEIITSWAVPNLTFNKEETQKRIRVAKENIKPAKYLVAKGEKIVANGEKVDYHAAQKLKTLYSLQIKSLKVRLNNIVGFSILISILVILMIIYLLRFQPKFSVGENELVLLSMVVLISVVLAKIIIWHGELPLYIIPIATSSMLIAIFLNQEIALLATVFLSIVVSIMSGDDLELLILYFGSGMTAIYASSFAKVRSDLTKTGIVISLINIGIVSGFGLVNQVNYASLGISLLWAFSNGMISAILAMGILPFLENLFMITTNFKLLELSDLNTPILHELSLEAPGTYHHSQLIGNLAERAADAVGANILLARVGAYYHDIGKVNKPEYFVENQTDYNRHEGLKPTLSASILKAHVKDGVEIAKKGKLPQRIIDIIQEHHGNSLMSYFYHLACEESKGKNEKEISVVDEESFRYPGPLPQSKEAAIIMLADAVEATIRTLPKPTHTRIEGTVKKVINNKFIDSQLDECDLSLRDLNKIASTFSIVLSSAYHARVEYPKEEAFKERTINASSDNKPSKKRTNKQP
ncbi:MAG: HDIG domain-containing protein [bacterium]|nr:HDIG domain-containing protein [bacterium]